jgi:hypothetical protein
VTVTLATSIFLFGPLYHIQPCFVLPIRLPIYMHSTMSSLPHTPNEVLALQHVIENLFGIPPDNEVHSGFKVLWVNTINDLMSIKPRAKPLLPYSHPTFDEDSEPADRKCRFPSWFIVILAISCNNTTLFTFGSRFRPLISPHENVTYYMKL